MANGISSRIKWPAITQIVILLAILAEALVAFAWLKWLSLWPSFNWAAPPLNLISCFAQALFSGFIMQVAVARSWSGARLSWVILPGNFLLLLVLLRLNNGGGITLWDAGWANYADGHLSQLVAGLVFGIFLSWRGIAATRQRLSFSDLYRKFIFSVGALIVLLVVWGLAGSQMPSSWSAIGIYLLLFFGVGLLSLALANLETLRTELAKYKEAPKSFSRRWISILVVLVLAILGISIAVMGIFSTDFLGTAVHALGVGAGWLLTGVAYLLYPVGLLVAGLYYVLQWIIHLLRGGEPPKFTMPDFSDLQKQAEGQPTANVPLIVLLILKWGLLILLIGILIFLLSRALVRFWQGKDLENSDDENESFFSWGILRGDLKDFWNWIIGRFRRKRRGPAAALDSGFISRGEVESDTDIGIRDLYRNVLRRGYLLGSPRKPFETPYEYERRLEDLVPETKCELDQITEAYIRERYGQPVTEPDRLALLNRLWRSLKLKLVRKP